MASDGELIEMIDGMRESCEEESDDNESRLSSLEEHIYIPRIQPPPNSLKIPNGFRIIIGSAFLLIIFIVSLGLMHVSPSNMTPSSSKGRPRPEIHQLGDNFSSQVEAMRDTIRKRWGSTVSDESYSIMKIPSENRKHLVSIFAKKIATEESLLTISFTGTSVTAGHDNYHNMSYPLAFERTFQPVVESLGIELKVDNLAMGNNQILPYDMCMGTYASQDTDIITWEQDMMCTKGEAKCVELFLRNAYAVLKNRPPVCQIQGVPQLSGISKIPRLISHYYTDNGKDLHTLYESEGFHSLLSLYVLVGNEENPKFSSTHLLKDGKPGVKTRAWHPGPFGHQLVADLLAWNYATILEEAFQLVSSTENGTYEYEVQSLNPDKMGDDDYLMTPTGYQCFTGFEPKSVFRNNDLLDLISEQIQDRRDNFSVIPEDIWAMGIWKSDRNAVVNEISNHLGHVDMKYVVTGNMHAGNLDLTFTSKINGYLFICQPPGSWGKFPPGYGELDTHGLYTLDGNTIHIVRATLGGENSSCFYYPSEIQSGDHSLSINARFSNASIAISHVLFP